MFNGSLRVGKTLSVRRPRGVELVRFRALEESLTVAVTAHDHQVTISAPTRLEEDPLAAR